MIQVLLGEINSGKSTAVLQLCRDAISRGIKISGWITPAYLKDDCKMGHDFVLLKQGKLYDAMPFTRSNFMQDSFIWRKYHFNKEAFRLAAKISTACDLFVMDEIGPLELEDGMGFSNTLDRVIKSGVNSLIVARTKVKPLIQKLLPNQNVAYGHF